MRKKLEWCWLVILIAMLLGACRPVEQSSPVEVEPTVQAQNVSVATPTAEAALVSPLDSPLTSPLVTPVAADALNSPLPEGAGVPADLVILHTNDTWGYYDPCG